MSKDKLIPELRFPDFKSEGEWRTDLLGNLVEIKGRIGYRGYTREDIVEEGKGAITLSPSNFEESGSLNFEKCTYITWEKYEESPEIKLEEGQTVLVKTASVGKSAYVGELPAKATINPQIVILKPQKIESKFLAYSIFHNYVQIQIKSAVGVGAIPNMSQDSISKFDILLPPDKKGTEQQKIASCLSSLDELIAAHNEKLDALKDHKKGLMQNLFPQEGETVPKLRFPEFEDDGEWDVLTLEECVDVIDGDRGKNYPKGDEYSSEVGYCVFLSAKNVTKNGFSFNEVQFISKEKDELLRKGKLKREDIVLTTRGSLGQFAFYNSLIPFNHLRINSGMVILRVKEKLKAEYFYTYCHSNIIRTTIENIAFGNAVQQLTVSGIKNFPLLMPTNGKEQQKIASCLLAVDELITAEGDKIEQLLQHKKGLMQGLFPQIKY